MHAYTKKIIKLEFMKNRNYHERKATDWCIVTSLLLKPLMQCLMYVISFRLSKCFILDPFCSVALIILILFFQIFGLCNETKFPTHVSFFSIFFMPKIFF